MAVVTRCSLKLCQVLDWRPCSEQSGDGEPVRGGQVGSRLQKWGSRRGSGRWEDTKLHVLQPTLLQTVQGHLRWCHTGVAYPLLKATHLVWHHWRSMVEFCDDLEKKRKVCFSSLHLWDASALLLKSSESPPGQDWHNTSGWASCKQQIERDNLQHTEHFKLYPPTTPLPSSPLE